MFLNQVGRLPVKEHVQTIRLKDGQGQQGWVSGQRTVWEQPRVAAEQELQGSKADGAGWTSWGRAGRSPGVPSMQ